MLPNLHFHKNKGFTLLRSKKAKSLGSRLHWKFKERLEVFAQQKGKHQVKVAFTFAKANMGFTLIELLVSIVILSFLAILVIASINLLPKQINIDTTAQSIISTLATARNQTVSSDGAASYGVHFESDMYILFTGTAYVAGASTNKEYELSEVEISAISLTGGGSDVVFDRIRGTTATDGSVVIRLVSDTSRTETIKINSSGQASLDASVTQLGTRLVDSRHLHFELGWSIQNSTTLTLNFSGTTPVTQNIAMVGFFNLGKTDFDWSGTVAVDGVDQVLHVQAHSIDAMDTVLSIHRDKRFNTKALSVSIDSKEIVSYTAVGVATVGAFGGAMTVQ